MLSKCVLLDVQDPNEELVKCIPISRMYHVLDVTVLASGMLGTGSRS
jgi:hypothetical protein